MSSGPKVPGLEITELTGIPRPLEEEIWGVIRPLMENPALNGDADTSFVGCYIVV